MSEQRELGSRREERMENGVNNLKGARLFPKTFSNNGNGDACIQQTLFDIVLNKVLHFVPASGKSEI